jgi:GH15 family glucan-1,4-alpha-glucosidase
MSSLDLGVIGNSVLSALIDSQAKLVWCCYPRLDGDPIFNSLVDATPESGVRSEWNIELDGLVKSEQQYVANTAVLSTRLFSGDGSAIEIVDFCPRFEVNGRVFRPQQLVRRIIPRAGTPRVRIALRPRFDYGASAALITHGSSHIRYEGTRQALRVTTDAPISYLLEERAFLLEETVSFLFGSDETLRTAVADTAREFQERTEDYWRQWVRRLAIKADWQEAVIRAAITLKLCTFEETGAIVSAMTTSVPEVPDSKRNWDARYCWLRDSFLVVRALNSLSEVETMEHYLRYLSNVVTTSIDRQLQPVYGITLDRSLDEREEKCLSGYRGMGPIRVGNQACEHIQHDVYGNIVLAASQAFFDHRLLRPATVFDFKRLERVGERAFEVHATPDAGMWESRSRARVHTSSALMCWAACDRLARIAARFGLHDRVGLWCERAGIIRHAIETHAWNESLGRYAESFNGVDVEAGLLLMCETGFHHARHSRFLSTVSAIEQHLRRGPFMLRYTAVDDYGEPASAFNACTFWYIDVLARMNRAIEARDLFENMLSCRNHLGLLSEDIDPGSRELWGNYPQTCSLVGIINAAMRLSRPWEDLV